MGGPQVSSGAELPARRAAGEVSAERWAALHPLILRFPGTLPELLDGADRQAAGVRGLDP
ncbi:hypothetical protein [Kitasatospora sp. NPDC094015]|uniref:hypothetical protein n=1 Tax=Kitasatospora sp. NPDC094015 TaxID=3155205 RepID=UPI003326CF2F